MTRWQYWSYKTIYGTIVFPIYVILSISKRMTPFDLVHVNKTKGGVMPYSSKYTILEPFKKTNQFLKQHKISITTHKKMFLEAKEFMQKNKLTYPIIAKPEHGIIGIGITKISSDAQLQKLFLKIPSPYILQEYADYPFEFGVYFRKYPGNKEGQIVSLTQKNIPFITGDGKHTVEELIVKDTRIRENKQALLTHATTLKSIPKKGEHFQIILQASHTYGTVFVDKRELITPELTRWVNTLCKQNPEVHFARFDIKCKTLKGLQTGKDAKIIELNGVTAEPIHIYDDKYPLSYAIKTFYTFIKDAFTIAKENKQEKTNSLLIFKTYKKYVRSMSELKKIMG